MLWLTGCTPSSETHRCAQASLRGWAEARLSFKLLFSGYFDRTTITTTTTRPTHRPAATPQVRSVPWRVKSPWAGIPAERLHWQINLRWATWHLLSQRWLHPQDEDGADETVRVKMKRHVCPINRMVAQLWCSIFKGPEWDSGRSQVRHSTCGCGVTGTPILKQWTPRTWGKAPIYIPNKDQQEKFSCRCLMKETTCRLAHLHWWAWTWSGHLPTSRRSDLEEWRAWQAHCSVRLQRAGKKGHHKIGQNCSKNRLW